MKNLTEKSMKSAQGHGRGKKRQVDNETQGGPQLERVRFDLKYRNLTVLDKTFLTPNMIRITLGGEDLADFTSVSADDHVKVFIPTGSHKTLEKRDYTPRYFDAQAQTLVLDFAVHEAGPATSWAINATVGSTLGVGGPRGSQIIKDKIKRWVLIGDETALPAIGRRIEELPEGTTVTSIVTVPTQEDIQELETATQWNAHWLPRSEVSYVGPESINAILKDLEIVDQTYVWLAGESGMIKTVRQFLLGDKKISRAWIKAAGYWKQGNADAHERFE